MEALINCRNKAVFQIRGVVRTEPKSYLRLHGNVCVIMC